MACGREGVIARRPPTAAHCAAERAPTARLAEYIAAAPQRQVERADTARRGAAEQQAAERYAEKRQARRMGMQVTYGRQAARRDSAVRQVAAPSRKAEVSDRARRVAEGEAAMAKGNAAVRRAVERPEAWRKHIVDEDWACAQSGVALHSEVAVNGLLCYG